MPKKLVIVCLSNFLIAAFMGLLLRFYFIQPVSLNFRFLTHAHSHVAMLGWVYLMLYVLIVHHFIPDKKPVYNRLFWATQVAVVGMMVGFPIQGYAAISISFSTLHIFCSYYFVRLVWKHHQSKSKAVQVLLKASLIFMLLSTIGVWCLGPAVGLLGQASAFYQIAIQFFLHFQFNGWFLFAVLAIFLHQFPVEQNGVFKRFYVLILAATLFTFALPVSWFAYHPMLLWINGFGVILQLITGFYFIKLLMPYWRNFWASISKITKWLYGLALLSFILKIVLQTSSIVPEVAAMAYQYRNFVIGFIHLMMLGIITGFLFAFLLKPSLISLKGRSLNLGIYSFIFGFATTEVLLLVQGVFYYFALGAIPFYHWLLFLCSVLLPLGILLFILNILNHDSKTIKTT